MSPPICQGKKKPLSQLVTRSQKYDYKLVVISLPLDWGLPVSHPGDTHQHYHVADRIHGSSATPFSSLCLRVTIYDHRHLIAVRAFILTK